MKQKELEVGVEATAEQHDYSEFFILFIVLSFLRCFINKFKIKFSKIYYLSMDLQYIKIIDF